MKTTLSRIAALALPAVCAALVIFAASAEAEGNGASRPANVTAIGESLRSQLDGLDFQFAIAHDGRLDLTGSHGHPSPSIAVTELRYGALGGGATTCHLLDNGVEAVLIVTNAPADLAQPCAVLGEALDAA